MELCRKVIRLYQDIAVSWVMNKDTWYALVLLVYRDSIEKCSSKLLRDVSSCTIIVITHIVSMKWWGKRNNNIHFDCCFRREYMLAVILHVTLDLLKEGPPDNRDSTLGGILANILMKVHVHTNCYNLCCKYEYVRVFNNLYCCCILYRLCWCATCERPWCSVLLPSCGIIC